jgi:hypothetical protein
MARTTKEIADVCSDDCFGSWLCENALTEVLTRGDDGEVTVFVHFAEFGEFSIWKCF